MADTERVDIRAVPHWRARRSSPYFWRGIRGAIMFFLSLVPAGLIAWKLDYFPVRQQPAPLQVIEQQRALPPTPEPTLTPPAIIRPTRRQAPQEEPLLSVENRREDVQLPLPPAPPKADVVIDVDLSKPRQRVAVTKSAFQILRASGASDGNKFPAQLSRSIPAHIELDQTSRAALLLEVESLPSGLLIIVTPIVNIASKDVPFTFPNLDRIHRRLSKQHQETTMAIAALNNEREQLDLFINAPVAKPLAARGQARTRKLAIEKQLPNLQSQLAQIEADGVAITRLVELANTVHEHCTIELAAPTD